MSTAAKLAPGAPEFINAHTGALWAARRGLRVMRVKPNGKDPYRGGVNEATTSEATINRWFAEEPTLNYGIAMGGPDKLVTLDCDTKHPSYADDYYGLNYPSTLEFESRSGGAHILFKTPFDAGQKDLRGAKSINVRAEGGYIVGPGSIVDGKRYRVVSDAPIALCPDDIAARISRRAEKATDNSAPVTELDTPGAIAWADDFVKRAPGAAQGERNNALHRLTCTLKDGGVSAEFVLPLLLAEWCPRCDPPYTDEAEIEKTVASAYNNGQRPPGIYSPELEFEDLSAVPEVLACLGWWHARQQPPKPAPATGNLLERASDIRLDDIIAGQSNALVKGVLSPGNTAVLYGESTAGKSFVALDLGWHITMDKPWHRKKVNKAPVLYVALEGVSGFRKRMLAAKQHHGDPGVWFARLTLPVSLVRAKAGAEGMAKIIEAAKQLEADTGQPVGLIIVDTFARAISGDDENKAEDTMHFVNDRVGVIARATGAAVLTVAHTNRGGDLRGSLHMRNAQDVVLRVERKRNKDGSNGVNDKGQVFRSVEAEKVKDGEEGMLFAFALEQVHLGEDEDGEAVTSCIVRTAADEMAAERAKDTDVQHRYREAYQAVADKLGSPDVPLADVREAFIATCPTDRKDPKEVAKVKRDAWNHAKKKPPGGLEVYAKDGAEWVRPIRPKGRRGVTDPKEEFEPIGDLSGSADSSDYDFG